MFLNQKNRIDYGNRSELGPFRFEIATFGGPFVRKVTAFGIGQQPYKSIATFRVRNVLNFMVIPSRVSWGPQSIFIAAHFFLVKVKLIRVAYLSSKWLFQSGFITNKVKSLPSFQSFQQFSLWFQTKSLHWLALQLVGWQWLPKNSTRL